MIEDVKKNFINPYLAFAVVTLISIQYFGVLLMVAVMTTDSGPMKDLGGLLLIALMFAILAILPYLFWLGIIYVVYLGFRDRKPFEVKKYLICTTVMAVIGAFMVLSFHL